MMVSLKSFFKQMHTSSANEIQKRHQFRLMLVAESIIVLLLLYFTLSDVITGNKGYDIFSFALLVLYSLALILMIVTKGGKSSKIVICITLVLNFSITYFYKTNHGVGAIWLLLIPMLTMYIVGLAYGFYSSLLILIIINIFSYVPFFRTQISTRYLPVFFPRYNLLFFIDFMLSTIAMYNFHELRRTDNQNQKELEEAVVAERNKVTAISMQTIISISNAVEAKDLHIGKHSERVAYFSCLIARKLEWPEKEINRLNTIALLHDIGKVSVDKKILNKEDSLSEEEIEKLKEHTTVGGKILEGLSIIPNVDLGAKYHHERWDSKGYPDGLSGEEIPIEARIICIADSFDSMKFGRGYKTSIPNEQIKQEFIKGKNTQFDSKLTDIFLEICEASKWFDDYEVQ